MLNQEILKEVDVCHFLLFVDLANASEISVSHNNYYAVSVAVISGIIQYTFCISRSQIDESQKTENLS